MAGVTVFVFLLQKLPGFEITLNSTLQSIGGNTTSNFDKCNPNISNLIWHLNKNGSTMIETNIALRKKSELNSDLDEKSEFNLDSYYLQNGMKYNFHNDYYENNMQSENFPRGAPYLVAIFETVNNLTAQTCGGCLLSPHWVITPASCLNVLSYYKSYETDKKEHKSHYSIVANAVNPVEDGTVHNVTRIFIHPEYKTDSIKHPNEMFASSSLALMKIQPAAVKITCMKIFKNKLKMDNMDVRVYGWILEKNSMSLASFTTKTLDTSKCNSSYSFPRNSIICLRVNESNKILINKMNSGGPVMILHRNQLRLLGVAQLDMTSNVIVYLFAPHYDWITKVLTTT